MSSYSPENIADITGLKVSFVKKCLQKKPHLFKQFCHQDAGDSIRLNRKGLALFQKISDSIAVTQQTSAHPPHAAPLMNGEVQIESDQSESELHSPKEFDFQDYRSLMEKHQKLYIRLEEALHQIENEKAKRIDAENDLRRFFTEIKPLTDNHPIEQAITLRQNRRLRRAEIIGQLEKKRFFNTKVRKKLFEELKAFDAAYYYPLSEQDS